ncbi:MAG: acyltransferase [Bacteroidaceae bacterium]|nr:acyltransferase [Bacteroidaceae bacterium]
MSTPAFSFPPNRLVAAFSWLLSWRAASPSPVDCQRIKREIGRDGTAQRPATQQRQSGVELLRIVAMLFVLVVHVNYGALGYPHWSGVHAEPLPWLGRLLTEQVAIVCVDVFVLISGWFGIRPTLRGGAKYLFQVLFIALLVPLCFAVAAPERLAGLNWADALLGRWFVRAYLALFVLSPVLNAFVERASKRQMEAVLAAFFAIQTVDLLLRFKDVYNDGYGAVSFVGLYLLARYVRLHRADRWLRCPKAIAAVWAVCVIVPPLVQLVCALFGAPKPLGALVPVSIAYTNPLVIVESLALLLLFVRLRFSSRAVNWVAASCFSVYLLHQHPLLIGEFFATARQVHLSAPLPLALVLDAAFILAVFAVSILVDRLRIGVWRLLSKK